jgi:UDP-4-amino-4,6-dideoxy-N-acetyl-beta-L-altrosamine N-acetyltransferase
MLPINLKSNFTIHKVHLINFVNLSDQQKEMIRQWRNNDKIKNWMYSNHVISKEEHLNFIERLKKDNSNYYWLGQEENSDDIGVVYLNELDRKKKNAYLGIYTNPDKLKVGKILIQCLKALAFEIVKLRTLKLEVIDNNIRAIQFYENAGFQREGVLPDSVYRDNKWCNILIMGMVNQIDDRINIK